MVASKNSTQNMPQPKLGSSDALVQVGGHVCEVLMVCLESLVLCGSVIIDLGLQLGEQAGNTTAIGVEVLVLAGVPVVEL